MEIINFLPSYPSIDEETFNETILRKKEFYDLRGEPEDPFQKKGSDIYQDYQEIIRRFLSPYTLYDELLLYHSMGSGKTFSAVGVADKVLSAPNSSFKKVLIIVPNEILENNFINHILYRGLTGDKYAADIEESELIGLSPTQIEKRKHREALKKMHADYFIDRFRSFYNAFSHKTDEQLRQLFSNTVIIFDEIHNLLRQEEYDFFHRLLHVVENRKILLMSGTPMVDDVSDFALVMNLILPLSSQLPTGTEFRNRLIDGEFLLPEADEVITKAVSGRVSYLRSLQSNVESEFIGEPILGVRFFNLYPTQMDTFQSRVYTSVYENEQGGWRRNSIQASLFVFPDRTIGREGFNRYIQQNKNRYSATKEWRDVFRVPDDQRRLDILYKYSCKYARIIEHILNSPREKVFVYNQSIEEGGVLLFAECLKLFGFQQVYSGFNIGRISKTERNRLEEEAKTGKVYRGNSTMDRRLRFIVLSDKVIKDKPTFDKLLRTFNDVRNQHGQYIQVIIGGKQVSEGLSFKDVSQVHVATPHWNYTVTSQAIARVLRFRSHRDPNALVRVYLHAAIPQGDVPAIDIEMYKRSEIKDILIHRLTRLIEKASFDCALNYERNRIIGGTDGSRECNYDVCSYRCDGVEFPYTRTPEQLDWTTYNLYYTPKLDSASSLWTSPIWLELTRIFSQQFNISVTDLLRRFSRYDTFVVLKTLQYIIQNHIAFEDRFGNPSYLHIDHDQLFLSETIFINQKFTNTIYIEEPIVRDTQPFEQLLEDTISKRVLNRIASLMRMPVRDQIRIIDSLPRKVQEMYIENSVQILLQRRDRASMLTKQVVEHFEKFIHYIDRNVYSTLLLQTEGKLRVYNGRVWKDASLARERIILDHNRLIEGNNIGYYIRVNTLDNSYNIVELTGRESDYTLGGIDCTSKTVVQLEALIRNVMKEEPVSTQKGLLCNQIREWFIHNNLAYYI